jgi:maltose alpha-D-glucosyltransferase / alpha-amylase
LPTRADRYGLKDLAALATPSIVRELAGAYVDSAQQLGRRTAELHLALSSDTATPAFAPEPFTRDDMARLVAAATGEVRRARESLDSRVDALAPDAAASARALLARAEQTLHQIHEGHVTRAGGVIGSRSRIHGDYHLGQVLWAEGDFYLLDFEGEPARPLEQRRQKESPLKDVAGMLRSFSYAAYAALFAHTTGGAAEFERLEPWARVWQHWTSAAFLTGYFAAAGGASFVPADPVQRAALLDLFLLDKALYELNYELNSRPDWIRIPLRGLMELLG